MESTQTAIIKEQDASHAVAALPSETAMDRLSASLERAYPNMGPLLLRSFLMGIATALGATAGLAILLWLIGWVLNGLGYFEPLKPVIAGIQRFVQTPPSATPTRSGGAPAAERHPGGRG